MSVNILASLFTADPKCVKLPRSSNLISPPVRLWSLHFYVHDFLSIDYLLHILPSYIIHFIHSVVCLTTGPKPLPKRALHIVRSRASSFKREYPLLSLRSSSSFLRLLPRLPVTSLPPLIFPSITRCIRQFIRKM